MRSLPPVVTEGPRSQILDVVARVPGVHLRSIERRTALPLGQVLYHLDRLERMGLVSSQRDAGFRRYFVANTVTRPEKVALAALRHDLPRRLMLTLLESPGLTHKQMQERAGVAGSTLSFHLQRLVASGAIERDDEARYRVGDAEAAARVLHAYAGSFDDPKVHAYVAAQARTRAQVEGVETWSTTLDATNAP